MATTVNNTTINTKLTIIFDADVNPSSANDGPASGSGNTESDVYIDNKNYLNLRSHTEVDATVHALQWNATTNTGHIELTSDADNQSISSLPQWATNVVIRCEAQDVWQTNYDSTYTSTYNGHSDANAEDDSAAQSAAKSAATSAANTARDNYLSGNSITY
tara:strand:- start:2868 stop:3350 length:483 start_codon:yes stop_codon:yes gene_type:complete